MYITEDIKCTILKAIKNRRQRRSGNKAKSDAAVALSKPQHNYWCILYNWHDLTFDQMYNCSVFELIACQIANHGGNDIVVDTTIVELNNQM